MGVLSTYPLISFMSGSIYICCQQQCYTNKIAVKTSVLRHRIGIWLIWVLQVYKWWDKECEEFKVQECTAVTSCPSRYLWTCLSIAPTCSALPKNNEVKILCSTGHHGTFPISLWTVTVHCDQGKRPWLIEAWVSSHCPPHTYLHTRVHQVLYIVHVTLFIG